MFDPTQPLSPQPRPMSPPRPELIQRPSSRCETLLRETLRRDEYERCQSISRSRGNTRSRPRGNSLLDHMRSPAALMDGEGDYEEEYQDSHSSSSQRRGSFDVFQPPALSAPRAMRAVPASIPPEVVHYPYGSPSSPTPMPPPMHRMHTAPALPHAGAASAAELEAAHMQRAYAPQPTPQSPRASRHSLPNPVSTGARRTSSAGPQYQAQPQSGPNDVSPRLRPHPLSPHEAVLRAKLESVLHRAGPPSLEVRLEERGIVEQRSPQNLGSNRSRNHKRSQSQLVGAAASQGIYGDSDPSPPSRSPQSLASSSLSASGTDLARLQMTANGHSRNSYSTSGVPSPSSPSEPITPPPTPPFNAGSALEVCKRMEGYVSFASIEGLGEPAGIDIESDADAGPEDARRWGGRFWRVLSFMNGGQSEHESSGLVAGREPPASR